MKLMNSNNKYVKSVINGINGYSRNKIISLRFIWWWCTDFKKKTCWIRNIALTSLFDFNINRWFCNWSVYIPYRHIFIRSMYKTTWPKHSHSPIYLYNRRPRGPAPWPHFMEYCLYMAHHHVTRISYDITISASTVSLRQELTHGHFRYPTLAPS